MPSYLERYLAGERAAVWDELTKLGAAVAQEPLATDAQAVALETMRRARVNVEVIVSRLTALGYQFINTWGSGSPTPHTPPTEESLAALSDVEEQYGLLPLSLRTWHTVVGAVDFMGSYPRLSAYQSVDLRDMELYLQGQRLRVSLTPDLRVLGTAPEPAPNPDAGVSSDPLVIFPCDEGLVDEVPDDLDEPEELSGQGSALRYHLCLAPDALHKENVSGGDGPHMAFYAQPRMDAPLSGDDWEGVPFIIYLRMVFAWGGFPGLRQASNPPRDLLALLCEGLLPL